MFFLSFELFEFSFQSVEEMDVFDTFDGEIQPHSSNIHNTKISKCPTKNVLYPELEMKHRFLQRASPDSDGSPAWYPTTAIQLPSKPSHSPSPPPKLYPRRLY